MKRRLDGFVAIALILAGAAAPGCGGDGGANPGGGGGSGGGGTGASTLSVELAAGNIDRDAGDELVVVFNQMDLPQRSGIASYWVFDDEKAGFAELVKNASISATSTVYRGTIGSIGEANFADHVFSAGRPQTSS